MSSNKDQNGENNLDDLTQLILDFCEERDWRQFHNLKDLSLSLSLEASEVLEHFQWKTEEEIQNYIEENKEEIGDELADVFYWILLLSHDLNIDLPNALRRKMSENKDKYPVEKARGKHDKYTDL